MLFGADRERVGPCPAKASTIPARISRRQVYLGVAQRLGTEEAGDAGDQRLGGVRLAVTELAEQVLVSQASPGLSRARDGAASERQRRTAPMPERPPKRSIP